MASPASGTAVVGQAGGPTVVINQSLVGVIQETQKCSHIKRLLGARHGVRGIINEQFYDLMRQQADISREQNEQRIGTTARVLVTNASNGMYTGRSEYEAPDADGLIHFTSAQPVAVGTFADVRIDRADTYDLFGTCIGREKTL